MTMISFDRPPRGQFHLGPDLAATGGHQRDAHKPDALGPGQPAPAPSNDGITSIDEPVERAYEAPAPSLDIAFKGKAAMQAVRQAAKPRQTAAALAAANVSKRSQAALASLESALAAPSRPLPALAPILITDEPTPLPDDTVDEEGRPLRDTTRIIRTGTPLLNSEPMGW